jgi:hypothetical protein
LDNSLYDEVKEKIIHEIAAHESEIQITLRLARERYKAELTASRDYHKGMALQFEESGDNQLALRQRVLAEIYQSAINRA